MATDDLKARLPTAIIEQACCLSLHPSDEGYVVRVDCDDYGEAEEVLDWLTEGCHEAVDAIATLEAQLAARDAEIAAWLRGEVAYELAANSEHDDLLKLADAIERGDYRKDEA